MDASAEIADLLVGTRCMQIATGPRPARWLSGGQAGGLAAQSVTVLHGIRFPPSRLRAPVSQRGCRGPIALQTAMGARDEPP